MRGTVAAALVALGLIVLPAAAWAQGAIVGVVRDTSGAVLPGVSIEASSPALIERSRTVITDGNGQYRLVDLRPGTYTVTFTLAGFSVVSRQGLELSGSFTATVNAEMRVGAVEETVSVTAVTPTVDVQGVTSQRVLSHDVIDTIPTARQYYNLGVLIPGMSAGGQDVGGQLGDQMASLTIHGSKGNDQRVTLNGVNYSALAGGGSVTASVPNVSGVAEVTVDFAAVDASQSVGGVRVNIVPKEGGNRFAGTLFASGTSGRFQADNFSDDLRGRGLASADKVKNSYDFAPGFGGPLRRDKLWFYFTGRYNGVANYVGGVFHNANANLPNVWRVAPDRSRPYVAEQRSRNNQIRFTWQATQKQKLAFAYDQQTRCNCPSGGSATTSPEAATSLTFPYERVLVADWTAPITNRILLDASFLDRHEPGAARRQKGFDPELIQVVEQSIGLTYHGIASVGESTLKNTYYRASASYITGSHAFKVGYNGGWGSSTLRTDLAQPLSYRFLNGIPNQLTERSNGFATKVHLDSDTGLYAQDRWTVGRLTVNAGLRFDYFKVSFPEQVIGPNQLAPTRNLTYPKQDAIAWKDVTPKLGLSYDPFGSAKTAIKVTLNKYLAGQGLQGGFPTTTNPVQRLVTNTTRTWTDINGDFVPNCDLLAPLGNGECGPVANTAFNQTIPGTSFDPEILNGWGKRGYNWEFSAGVQQEILPRVSVGAGYFRRWYGNFVVQDNLALSAADYDRFSITAPTDSRLPVSGATISGLFDVTPAKFTIPASNYQTFASNYGKQRERWHGIDVTTNLRLENGILLSGGLSTGGTQTDNCEVVARVPEILLGANTGGAWTPLAQCRQNTTFLTQVKGLGSYTIPRVDVLFSATFQSVPGVPVLANYIASNALVTPSLGRPLAGNAPNLQVSLVPPGTLYGQRLNQLDLRFGKILRLAGTRTFLNVDLYNALNANTVLAQSNAFANWQTPQRILTARFLKFTAQFDF